METANGTALNCESDNPVGAALLLVIGEPVTDDHKSLILAEVTKGFRGWNVEQTGIDINDELARIANRADMGEEGPNGERTIHHRSDGCAVEILINPRMQTLNQSIHNFLLMSAQHKHLIYAGHIFGGSGSWVLQDNSFSLADFARVCKDSDIENALKQNGGNLVIYTSGDGDWRIEKINKLDISKNMNVVLNPEEKLSNVHGVLQFTAYVANFIKAKTLQELMRTSDVVGSIRFSKPTLYIFPACEGDSALFGISGFNLLVNGGYSRKSCFWDFSRHLDRIDAVLLSHLGTDNIFGISSVLKRKSMERVHPEIGYMFLNAADKSTAFTECNGAVDNNKDPNLVISLTEEGSKIIEFSKHLGPSPQSCTRIGTTQQLQPINLYHKVGHGSLDMYILNPVSDSKELKDFYQQWNKQVADFGSAQNVPLPNMLSICSLLVWRPSDHSEKITRIFFPGNTPQHKLIEGFEKLKHLEFLKRPSCSAKDLLAKPATKKGTAGGASSRPASSKPSVKTNGTEAKKHDSKPASAKAPTSARSNKVSKEDENKKKAEDKGNKSKLTATKPPNKLNKSDLSSPRKPASTTLVKKSSPTDPKKKNSPEQSKSPAKPEKAETEVMKPSPPEVKSPSPEISPPSDPHVDDGEGGMSGLGVGQSSLIDITPEEPNKSLSDMLVPTHGEENVAQKSSESPDPLPDPNNYDNTSVNQGESSLMYGSFHQDLQDDIMVPQNGDFRYTGGDLIDQSEPIQPESLPEPVAYSPQEPDLIPDVSQVSKEPQYPFDDLSPQRATPPEPDVVPSLQMDSEPSATESALAITPQEEEQKSFEEDVDTSTTELQSEETENVPEESSAVEPSVEGDSELVTPHEQILTECAPTEGVAGIVDSTVNLSVSDEGQQEQESFKKSPEPELVPVECAPTEEVAEIVDSTVNLSVSDGGQQEQESFKISPEPEPEPVPAEFVARSPDLEEPQQLQDEDEEAEFSPDEEDSQGDIRESKENQGDISPYAFENKGFRQDTEISQDEALGDEASTEPVEDLDSDEGHCVDAFEKDEDNTKESEIVEEQVDEGQQVLEVGPAVARESEEQEVDDRSPHTEDIQFQNGDYLEVSNIPEAFEKDETPDPTELRGKEVEYSDPADEEERSFSPAEVTGVVYTEEDQGARAMESEEQRLEHATYNNGGFNSFIGLDNTPQDSLNPFAGAEETSNQQSTELSPENPFLNSDQMLGHHSGNSNPFGEQQVRDEPEQESVHKMQGFDPFSAEEKELEGYEDKKSFDPEAEWGRPLGLPSPPPPEETPADSGPVKQNGKPSPKSKTSTAKKSETTRSVTKSKTSEKTEKKSSTTTTASKTETKTRTVTSKPRPASAVVTSSESKAKPTRRPATASGSRSSPSTTKLPPLPPLTPFYMDLSYIPNHGDPAYSDVEFFKRVRARHYVLSSLSPNLHTLNALLDAKQTWEDKELKVTLIPTYDNDTLRHWMGLHKERLCELNVDVAPSASRCTITLQDHETSCSAYRLEF